MEIGTKVKISDDYDGFEAGMVGTIIDIQGKSITVKFHDGGQDFFYERFIVIL